MRTFAALLVIWTYLLFGVGLGGTLAANSGLTGSGSILTMLVTELLWPLSAGVKVGNLWDGAAFRAERNTQ